MQEKLRVVLKSALRPYHRLIREDLFPRRTIARPEHRTVNTWTLEQATTFLARTMGERLGLLWRLALGTGMRRGEMLALKWKSVHNNGCIEVIGSLDRSLEVGPTKTKGSRRRIAVDAALAAALEERRGRPDEYVFLTAGRKPLGPRNVLRDFRAAVARVQEAEAKRGTDGVDVPSIRLHDLRHTHATLLLQANVHPKVVSERLGHASVKITLDLYSHAIPSMQAAAAEVTQPNLRLVG